MSLETGGEIGEEDKREYTENIVSNITQMMNHHDSIHTAWKEEAPKYSGIQKMGGGNTLDQRTMNLTTSLYKYT